MTIILTRYLYNKDRVIDSLRESIDCSDYQESTFWAYELFYSGFQKEVIALLTEIYEKTFSKNHPKLGIYIKRKLQNVKDESIATIVKNLTMKRANISESAQTKFVNVKEYHIEPFRTISVSTTCNWKYLRTVCKYAVCKKKVTKKEEELILSVFRETWLYAASLSPIWLERIAEYHGKIDKRKKIVRFESEEQEELFYETFGFEPDEQPLELQKKCMGII
jgi:hypothetical protein